MEQNYFTELNAINVSDKIEKKGKLSYLSWAWAWAELKKHYPSATYTVYKDPAGCIYHTDGKTAWVETGVTVEGIEHIEYLPVMDTRNASLSLDRITSFDVNKTIQRSLTKAVARHGLGLYIYAGEDLPDGEETEPKNPPPRKVDKTSKPDFLEPSFDGVNLPWEGMECEECGEEIKAVKNSSGEVIPPADIAQIRKDKYGKALCSKCAAKAKLNENAV